MVRFPTQELGNIDEKLCEQHQDHKLSAATQGVRREAAAELSQARILVPVLLHHLMGTALDLKQSIEQQDNPK